MIMIVIMIMNMIIVIIINIIIVYNVIMIMIIITASFKLPSLHNLKHLRHIKLCEKAWGSGNPC